MQSDLAVLVFPQISVDLIREVDHLLADLNTNEHIVVFNNFGEEFGGAHSHLDNGHFVVVFLDVDQYLLEELNLLLEELAHTAVLGLLGVDGVAPDERRDLLPHRVSVVLVVL